MDKQFTSDPHWRKELESLSPWLLTQHGHTPWQIPQGYFKSLPGQVLIQLEADAPKIPANYFDHLPDRVMARIQDEENQDPTLGLSTNKQPFQVPDGYFEQLPNQVVTAVNRQSIRTIQLHQSWQGLAAAAVILAAIVVAMFIWQPANKEVGLSFEDLSSQELTNYMADNLDDWNSNQLIELSGQDLTIFFDSTQSEQIENWVLDDLDIEDLEDLL